MNYRNCHPTPAHIASQRERQAVSANPPRHPAFFRAAQRVAVLEPEDRAGIAYFNAGMHAKWVVARNAYVKRMLERYGAVRTSRLIGYAPKTLSQYRAAAEQAEREIAALGLEEWERLKGLAT
jgi:hypothetical protein